MKRGPAGLSALLVLLGALAAPVAPAQEAPPAPPSDASAGPAPTETPRAPRPPEGTWIVNLPSADVPAAGTLSMLFTHRFQQDLADSDIDTLFSFDSGAHIGIGLGYTPVENLQVWLQRSSNLNIYELSARYRLLRGGPFTVTQRVGIDWRTEPGAAFDLVPGYSRRGWFSQTILAFQLGDRARITAVPTFVSETSGQPLTLPKARYEDLVNVPVAVSIALTRSVNVQGELYPRLRKGDSPGVGWIAALEKTVLRHRFAFTVGNLKATTVDQYVASDFQGSSPHDYFIGFNIVRQWKIK